MRKAGTKRSRSSHQIPASTRSRARLESSEPYLTSELLLVIKAQSVSALAVTPWTAALQAPLYMGVLQARLLEWVAMHPGDLPDPGIEPMSLLSPAL